jgi:TonB family protein
MESTAEGGTGPAFAVGNTRMGTTADRAVAPTEVPKEAPGEDPPPGENKVASRLPSAGVTYTKPIRKRMPNLASLYPPTLKVQGVEADVKVSLSIDATGKVTAVRILTPSPYPEFNEAAKTAGMSEEYEPATRDGIAMPYSLPFTYRFRLEDE